MDQATILLALSTQAKPTIPRAPQNQYGYSVVYPSEGQKALRLLGCTMSRVHKESTRQSYCWGSLVPTNMAPWKLHWDKEVGRGGQAGVKS
jgi:hypothetical protein